MTIMSKVVDPLILKALQDELLRPEWVDEITKAVTNDVQARLNQEPARRVALSSQRAAVARKLDSLLAAAEDGIPFASLKARIGEPEAEIRQIDEELAGLGEQSTVDRRVFPTWVQQQLTDLAGLLHDAPQRAKAELKRLDVCFTLHPIRDEGKPFLRAEGTGDLDALCRTRDLPSTARSRAQMPESPHCLLGRDLSFDQDRKGTSGLLRHRRPEFPDLATVPYQTTRMLDRLNHLAIKDQMDRRGAQDGSHSEETVDTGTASRDRRVGPVRDKAREGLILVGHAYRNHDLCGTVALAHRDTLTRQSCVPSSLRNRARK